MRSTEMRSSVLSPLHHLRRTLDSLLSTIIPSRPTAKLSLTKPFPTVRVGGWTSLYEMVTFRPDVGYAEALRREQWQKGVVGWMAYGSGVGLMAGLAGAGLWAGKRYLERRR
jgi:kynurenine 3-monooxygenase